jgi:hypothetical protein
VRERRKEPREGSEIDPETACIQTVGAPASSASRVKRGRSQESGVMGQRLTLASELNRIGQAKRKRVRTGRLELAGVDPKADDLLMARLKVG